MTQIENKEVAGKGASMLVAMFVAGAGLGAAVALLASKARKIEPAKQAEKALGACDRAIKALENRIRIA